MKRTHLIQRGNDAALCAAIARANHIAQNAEGEVAIGDALVALRTLLQRPQQSLRRGTERKYANTQCDLSKVLT
jgi:hypothetical protein